MTYPNLLNVCRICGHKAYSHQVRGNKPRGECYRQEGPTKCRCESFVDSSLPEEAGPDARVDRPRPGRT